MVNPIEPGRLRGKIPLGEDAEKSLFGPRLWIHFFSPSPNGDVRREAFRKIFKDERFFRHSEKGPGRQSPQIGKTPFLGFSK